IIGPFTPFIFLVGSMLFFSRLFPYFIDFIALILWNTKRGLLSFAFKSILQRKHTTSRLMSLIAVSIALILFTAIIPLTIKNHLEEIEKYDAGSDFVLEGLNIYSDSVRQRLNNLSSDFRWTPTFQFNGRDRISRNTYYDVLVINSSSYKDSAFWKDDFFDNSISLLMNRIKENNTILVLNSDLKAVDMEVGDTLTVTAPDIIDELRLSLDIVGSFNYFSNFDRSYTILNDNYYFKIVMDMETYANNLMFFFAMTHQYPYGTDWQILVKLNEGANRTEVISTLEEEFKGEGIDITDSLEEINIVLESNLSPYKVVFAVINADFIVSFGTIVISMILFAMLVINERREELGLFKALGMVKSQISTLFITEISVVLAFSLVIGNLLGYIISKMFIESFLFGLDTQIPVDIHLPMSFFSKVNGIIIIGSLIVTMIPSIIISRKETSSLLRRE
ncbi:MAG: ABC transporter permease, partial [Candidatus Kariarchaeaceae archaeon]